MFEVEMVLLINIFIANIRSVNQLNYKTFDQLKKIKKVIKNFQYGLKIEDKKNFYFQKKFSYLLFCLI